MPEPSAPPLLFTPLRLRGMQARNRVVVSPMCQYHSVEGGPTDWHMVILGQFAVGGAGIVFCEETAVEPRGRKSHSCAGIWDDAHIRPYRRITDFIRDQGAVPAIQLGHSGRKASVHGARAEWAPLREADAADGLPPWQGLAPSPLLAAPGKHIPREMDRDDIAQLIEDFRTATLRSLDAGFELVEIHGAHGYLLHQFLSPLSNRRGDAYGGDFAGRSRLVLEVTEAMRAALPDEVPLFYRVSSVDGEGGVWSLDDTVRLARGLRERGVDLVDCSAGGISGDSEMPIVPRVPGYQAGFAERVRREAGVPTIAVGGITEAAQAEAILQAGQADLIAIARELQWNPYWPAHAAKALGVGDDYGQLPEEVAYRLRKRDADARLPVNRPGPAADALLARLAAPRDGA